MRWPKINGITRHGWDNTPFAQATGGSGERPTGDYFGVRLT
jgi:hypothetical protein